MTNDNLEDVICFLKLRFALINSITICGYELPKSASCCCCFRSPNDENMHHLIASRESLNEEENELDENPQKNLVWNIVFVRIAEDNRGKSLENVLSMIFPDEDVENGTCLLLERNLIRSTQMEEKRLLVLEEAGGFCIRQVKMVC